MAIERIAVIGGGTMGNGIAHVCAVGGRDVRITDVSEDVLARALATIEKNLDRQVEKEVLDSPTRDGALSRILPTTSLDEALDGSQLVIEAVPEKAEIKFDLFCDLDRKVAPGVILASNTSSISITAIAGQTERPDRVIGMHFMNPVPVMRLIEVIRGLATSDVTTEAVMDLSAELGKTPVEVNDSPGFVSNRILGPMINEAVFALMEGVAEVEAIDTVMKLGMKPSHGPSSAGRSDRPRHLPEHHGSSASRSGRRPVSTVSLSFVSTWLRAGWDERTGRGFYDYGD